MNKFPNGFTSWVETHHEVVEYLTNTLRLGYTCPIALARQQEQGTGGLYELGEELTDKFEALNKGREWDGEFFDELEDFLEQKLHP
jgi:hypothetical protein